MPDVDRYPTDKDLDFIKNWDIKDISGLIEFLESIWWMADWGFKQLGNKLELHTGGWSGNESIIGALQQTMFWMMTWQKSERGGHYWFEWGKQAPTSPQAKIRYWRPR